MKICNLLQTYVLFYGDLFLGVMGKVLFDILVIVMTFMLNCSGKYSIICWNRYNLFETYFRILLWSRVKQQYVGTVTHNILTFAVKHIVHFLSVYYIASFNSVTLYQIWGIICMPKFFIQNLTEHIHIPRILLCRLNVKCRCA